MSFKSAECPNCRYPISPFRTLGSTAWSQWRCKQCGSKLSIDTPRRMLAIIGCIPATAFLLFVVRFQDYPYYFMIPMGAIPILGFVYLLDRVKLLESAGFRCQDCGYDLQGQTNNICAECGTEFDSEKLAAYKAGLLPKPIPINPWLRRTTIALIFLGITLTLMLGVIRLVRAKNSKAPPPANTQAPPATDSPANTTPPPTNTEDEGP